MGTFLKYAFYIALVFIIYVVISGFYDGKITKNSSRIIITHLVCRGIVFFTLLCYTVCTYKYVRNTI